MCLLANGISITFVAAWCMVSKSTILRRVENCQAVTNGAGSRLVLYPWDGRVRAVLPSVYQFDSLTVVHPGSHPHLP